MEGHRVKRKNVGTFKEFFFRPLEVLLLLGILSTFCMFETYKRVGKRLCVVEEQASKSGRTPVEYVKHRRARRDSGLILEYAIFGRFALNDTWRANDCHNDSCTRVLIETPVVSNSSFNTSDFTNSTYSAEQRSKVIGERNFIMGCEEVEKLWTSKEVSHFRFWTDDGEITAKRGLITNSEMFQNNSYIILKEAFNKQHANKAGYQRLYHEYKKRMQIGWNMVGLAHFYGCCVTHEKIRLVMQYVQGNKLCDDVIAPGQNFTFTPCFKLTKLGKLIELRKDKVLAALSFVKHMMCFLAELEKKNVFVENLHGTNIIVMPDMSIVLESFESAIYYGEQNLLGNSICRFASDCASPKGYYWYDGSTNHMFYRGCADIRQTCKKNRCVGFNATMHQCGIAKWILQVSYNYMVETKHKQTLVHILKKSTNPFPHLRRSGDVVCREMRDMVTRYKIDKNKAPLRKAGYHIGVKHLQP